MKIVCKYGFYEFHPTFINDIAKFNEVFGYDLVFYKGVFIPSVVKDLREANFKNEFVGGINCKYSTFNKHDLFRFEKLTFDLANNKVVSIKKIFSDQKLATDKFSFATKNILQSGLVYNGSRINNFVCHYDFNVCNIEVFE